MPRHWFSLRIAGYVIVAALIVGIADTTINGFVVVHDPGGRIAGAALVGDGDTRPLRVFARGYWVARPRGDASIALHCRDGRVVQREYVTAGMRTTYVVTANDCPGVLASADASD